MFFGIYAVIASLFLMWNITEEMDYHRVLSNSNCLLIFSIGEKKADVCVPAQRDVECFSLYTLASVPMSFRVVMGVVLVMARALPGLSLQDLSLNELKNQEENTLNQLEFVGCILLMISSRSTPCICTKPRYQ